MKNILYIKSSIQGANSYSNKLGDAIVQKVIAKYPGSSILELNLPEINIPHLDTQTLMAFFTPQEQLTESQRDAIKLSDVLVQQLTGSDIVVIGAPLYNFSIPTTLKAWIDHITRAGITFGYGENGPIGLVTGKKVYIAVSSGGIYSEGPGKENDFVVPYLKSFLGFLGMTDVTAVRAEGLKVPGVQEHAMEKAVESIRVD